MGSSMAPGRSTKIISVVKWIRSSRLTVKNSLSCSSSHHERTLERILASGKFPCLVSRCEGALLSFKMHKGPDVFQT